jgi:hypothetical protein
LAIRFLTDSAFFKVQIQPDRSLRAANLVAEPGVEFGKVCGNFLV